VRFDLAEFRDTEGLRGALKTLTHGCTLLSAMITMAVDKITVALAHTEYCCQSRVSHFRTEPDDLNDSQERRPDKDKVATQPVESLTKA